MCTIFAAVGLSDSWPVLVTAIRDEAVNRRWKLPDFHWPKYPTLIGGLDERGGGTWLAVDSQSHALSFLVNRPESIVFPQKSRGELPLAVLSDPAFRWQNNLTSFDGFILGRADANGITIWEWNTHKLIEKRLPKGLHGISLIGVGELHPRLKCNMPLFASSPLPNPQCTGNSIDSWHSWIKIIAGSGQLSSEPTALLWTRTINNVRWASLSAACIAISSHSLRFDFTDTPMSSSSWKPTLISLKTVKRHTR